MLRAFTITDIGLLRKVTKQSIFLNNQIVLTLGAGAGNRRALLSPLSALTGSYTYVCGALVAQVAQASGSPLAHCVFIAPASRLDSSALPELLDGLMQQLGSRGGFNLVVELEEVSPAFKTLRQNGFSIYARQQVWKLNRSPVARKTESEWRPVFERDELGIHLLRNSLIPGQVQQIEADKTARSEGYVLERAGQVFAYAEIKRGPRGIWVQPFVPLDAEPFDAPLADLLGKLRPRSARPVYVSLRSYQDWMQSALEKMGAKAGPRQVVMARRTALPLPVEETRRVPVPNRNAEPSTPIHAYLPQVRREPEWISYDQTPNYR